MRELKVGDKVKVRSDLVGGKTYGGIYFSPTMSEYTGTDYKIVKIRSDNKYCLDEGAGYVWSSEMFEEEPSQDAVNTPSHYLHGGIETIEVIRMMLTPEEFRGYCKGNIIKYRERAMFKGNADEDFAKALKYKEFMEVVE